jgi:hypothetical protein
MLSVKSVSSSLLGQQSNHTNGAGRLRFRRPLQSGEQIS